MLTNLYVLIIIIPTVQISVCTNLSSPTNLKDSREHALKLLKFMRSAELDNKKVRSLMQNESKYFRPMSDVTTSGAPPRTTMVAKKRNSQERNYHEVKVLLAKLLEQIVQIEKDKRDSNIEQAPASTKGVVGGTSKASVTPPGNNVVLPSNNNNKDKVLKKKKKEDVRKSRWGHWTDWSSCSVSCGKGRQIRWRHCIDNCEEVETEMEEKTCQLPACGPGKLFGVIPLR